MLNDYSHVQVLRRDRFAGKKRKRGGFGWKRWSSELVYDHGLTTSKPPGSRAQRAPNPLVLGLVAIDRRPSVLSQGLGRQTFTRLNVGELPDSSPVVRHRSPARCAGPLLLRMRCPRGLRRTR